MSTRTFIIGALLAAIAMPWLYATAAQAQTQCQPGVARYVGSGALDTSFSGDGRTTASFANSSYVRAEAAINGPNGTTVVAGYAYTANEGYVFMLSRFKSDGSLDTSFDGDGKVLTDFTSQRVEQAYAIVMDAFGRMIVGGTAEGKFALARYNSNGSLDATFDGDGKVLTDFASMSGEHIQGLAIDHVGRIVAVGAAYASDGGAQFALARYNNNGSLDTSFDGDGKVLTDFSSSSDEVAYDVAIAPDGKIVVAGSAQSFDASMAVARYKDNGRLDRSFDGDGKVYVGSDAAAFSVLVDDASRVLVGGHMNARLAVARLTSAGALDGTFGSGGISIINFTSQNAELIQDMAFSGGKLYAVGVAFKTVSLFPVSNEASFVAVRLDTNGNLDRSFDRDGKLLTTFPGKTWSWGYAAVADPGGRLVAAGSVCLAP